MTEPPSSNDPQQPPGYGSVPPPPGEVPPPGAVPPPYGSVPPPGAPPYGSVPPPYGAPPPGAPPVAPPYAYGAPPPVPPGMYYDPGSGLVLPNGVQLASVGRRIGAYFLSFVLVIVTLVIGYIVWGLIIWRQGQTPALQVLGMRCWRPDDGRVPGFWWMAFREIIGRLADGILSFISELVSFVLFATTREHKALHDYVAGTVVLYDPNKVLDR